MDIPFTKIKKQKTKHFGEIRFALSDKVTWCGK